MTQRRLLIICLSLLLAGCVTLLTLLLVGLRGVSASANITIATGAAPTAHVSPTPTKAPTPPIFVAVWKQQAIAYDARTGKMIWREPIQFSGLYGLPVINNGVVFLGTDSDIYAWRLSDGKPVWHAQIATMSSIAPVLGASNIYFMTGPNTMMAIRQSDGTVQWHVDGGHQAGDGYATDGTPILVNGVIYFGASTLYAVHASDGMLLWKYHDSTANPVFNGESFAIRGTIFVDANRAYFNGVNREFYALKLADGTLAWKYPANSVMGALDGEVVPLTYGIGTQQFGNRVGALDAATGKLLWSRSTGTTELGHVVFANNGTFYYDNGTDVTAITSATGAAVWDNPNAQCTIDNVTIVNTTAYMDGQLACAIDLTSGNVLWRSTANQGYNMIVVNYQRIGTLLIALDFNEDDSGVISANVVALRLTDGTTAWHVNLFTR